MPTMKKTMQLSMPLLCCFAFHSKGIVVTTDNKQALLGIRLVCSTVFQQYIVLFSMKCILWAAVCLFTCLLHFPLSTLHNSHIIDDLKI